MDKTDSVATTKPEPIKEITWQSLLGGIAIAVPIAFSYPYVVLKLGQGIDASLLAAFLGALVLAIIARRTSGRNGGQNNVIQTIAGSAAATAFMCVVLAAFTYLEQGWSMETGFDPPWWAITFWLICSGSIGVLIVVRYRRFFVNHPRMRFPGGVAAAEIITVLDGGTAAARAKSKALGFSTAIGVLVSTLRDALAIPMQINFVKAFRFALPLDVLSFGTGMLFSLNVGLSGILGAIIVLIAGPMIIDDVGQNIVFGTIAPEQLEACRPLITGALTEAQQAFAGENCGMMTAYRDGSHFGIAMLWLMWPATAFTVTGALTAILIAFVRSRRRAGAPNTIKPLYDNPRRDEDMPVRNTLIGVVFFTILLAIVQHMNFGVSIEKTVIAVMAMVVIILAGVWVLGETNSGPVSLMANTVQAIFGIFWRHDVKGNLIAAGMAGDGNSQGEQVMQTYKTGQIIGSTPKLLTYAQLLGVPIGALAVAIMFPLLLETYGIGGENGLSAPTGLKLANMAVLIDRGLDAFPPGALTATWIAAILGAVFEALRSVETQRGEKVVEPFAWVPSASALGFGLILPPSLMLVLGLGAITTWVWRKINPEQCDKYYQSVAAGLVAGEALIGGLLLPILGAAGVL